MKTTLAYFLSTLLLCSVNKVLANEVPDTLMLNRIFGYARTIATVPSDTVVHSYTRYTVDIQRKNFSLLAVPSLFAMARKGQRRFMGESYQQLSPGNNKTFLSYTSLPHHGNIMPTVMRYLVPHIYNVTIVDRYLLSPFNIQNKSFYRYRFLSWTHDRVILAFTPKVDNTQLVRGNAVVDRSSGRVLTCHMEGEYDMLRFQLEVVPGTQGAETLLARECLLTSTFKFLGNRIVSTYRARYGIPSVDTTLIDPRRPVASAGQLRTDTLSRFEEELYRRILRDETARNSVPQAEGRHRRNGFWRVLGDCLIDRISSNFGAADQGYFRISPILNPFYMGYSRSRGFTYKTDVRGSYNFSSSTELSLRMKAGYSVREQRLYFHLPVTFFYDKRHNFYSQIELGTGNRISSTTIAERIGADKLDSLRRAQNDLYLFKDRYVRFATHYDFSSRWSLQVGFVFHKRTAVDKRAFRQVGMPEVYRSFAPSFEVQYRPLGWKGAAITIDYERSLKNILHSNTEYARWEIDAQYLRPLTRLRAISLRLGTGFYTQKASRAYFLDYSNFRENNIPGGWNDGWSGEFELLDANWYNTSNYYARANFTYETPLLALSWLPFFGHYIEMERLYLSALSVRELTPYFECGYGFTTRLFSIGLFVSNRNGRFNGFGCKFGFELFRHW